VAELCQPTPEGVAQALQVLAHNQQRRSELGKAGQALAQEKYTLQSFSRTLNQIYDQLGGSLACSTNHSVTHNAPHTEGQLTAVLHKAGSATNGSPELRVEQK
jgi:hypothetical protein